MRIGALILAGGKSSRMGANKAYLRLGGKTFLARISEQLSEFEEVLLSVDKAGNDADQGLTLVEDMHPSTGPIGGLFSALRACRSDGLLAIGCDMPLFRKELWEYMSAFVDDGHDAFVLTSRSGQRQPLCAIYRVSAAQILEGQIEAGNYRLMDALDKMRVREIPLRHSVFPDEIAEGVNTPEEYAALVRRVEGVPVIAVCGVKNSGKTRLLAGVIPLLRARGLRVAAIKHDGHDFDPDVKDTDSYRLREAGAFGVGLYSSRRYMLTAEKTGVGPAFFAPLFDSADLILFEGGKHSHYPKIEVVRAAVSDWPVSEAKTWLALCSDVETLIAGVPILPLDDYAAVAEVILDHLREEGRYA